MAINIKNAEQIEGVRKSSKLAAQTLKYLEEFAVAGKTTLEIDRKCEEYIRDHKALAATKGYGGFPASCCTSVNDVICHGIPSSYELRDGDILNIDVTTILDGYFGDTCKMYPIGEVGPIAQKLMDVAKECLSIGLGQCKPENYFGNIGYEINKYAASFGYGTVYEFCGHGVGLKFHEEPEVNHVAKRNSGKKMKPGMIFTIEPMINVGKARAKVDKKDGWTARTIDGKLSAQYEHTILVTETGAEALTDIYGEY